MKSVWLLLSVSLVVCSADLEEKVDKLTSITKALMTMWARHETPDMLRLSTQLNIMPDEYGSLWGLDVESETEVTSSEGNTLKAVNSIYSLLVPGQKSSRWYSNTDSSTVFVWQRGAPIRIHTIDAEGNYRYVDIGCPLRHASMRPHFLVEPKTWMAEEVLSDMDYSFISIFSAPGWSEGTSSRISVEEMQQLYPADEYPKIQEDITFFNSKRVSAFYSERHHKGGHSSYHGNWWGKDHE